jgi:hypothetical protein
MLKIFASAAMLIATLTLPATAQTSGTNPSPQTVAPSTQNSGAGVQGMPGNKSGPPAKSDAGTTGAAGNSGANPTTRQQDSSGIQGMPGNKSGPPARQPSEK